MKAAILPGCPEDDGDEDGDDDDDDEDDDDDYDDDADAATAADDADADADADAADEDDDADADGAADAAAADYYGHADDGEPSLRRGAHLSARTWRPEIPSARGSCHLVAALSQRLAPHSLLGQDQVEM